MEPQNLTTKRYFGIDLMKVIAAFMVTFYHFQRLDYGFTAGKFYLPNLNQLLTNLCVISVPLFFMCNGAILLNKEYSLRKIWGKALKILLLLLVWHWLPFPEWFFRTLCFLYMCYPLLKYISENGGWLRNTVCFGLLIVPFGLNLFTTALKLFPVEITVASVNLTRMTNTGLFTLYSMLYFLLGGILMKRRLPTFLSIVFIAVGFCLTTMEGVIYTNYDHTVYDGVNSSFPTVGALVMSVGIFDLMMRIKVPNTGWFYRSVTLLSRNVMGIYLFHLALILLIRNYMTAEDYPVILVLAISALIDGVCVALCALLHKIPYVRELVSI